MSTEPRVHLYLWISYHAGSHYFQRNLSIESIKPRTIISIIIVVAYVLVGLQGYHVV